MVWNQWTGLGCKIADAVRTPVGGADDGKAASGLRWGETGGSESPPSPPLSCLEPFVVVQPPTDHGRVDTEEGQHTK